ncbi:MAG: hypothetical protein PVG30_05110 [Gammaproteobacteria bacterium]|jgi:hypothetical protein
MKKRIVVCDTSFVRAKLSNILEIFPLRDWEWCISETIDLELNNPSLKPDEKERRLKIFKEIIGEKSPYKILRPRGQILIEEQRCFYENKRFSPSIKSLCSNKHQRWRKKLYKKRNEAALEKLNERSIERNKTEKLIWSQMLSLSDAAKIRKYCVSDIDWKEKVWFKDVCYNLNFQEQLFGSLLYSEILPFIKGITVEQAKENCPGIYLNIRFFTLITMLQRTENEKNQFTVYLEGEKIEIKKSFITDAVIALAYLPYIDCFATCDKGQAGLLKFIAKDYQGKVKIY